jgi:NAD(P)-dependent dehydrogenase (short-subunit alcohol dehydrogenase family)
MKTAIVTGGSRGLGRGIVEALRAHGMRVIAIAQGEAQLHKTASETGCETIVGDASDDALAGRVLADHTPDLVVLAAGAKPPQRAIHLQTWESFSHNWHIDTKQAFVWLRNALLLPTKPGAHVIVISSGAAMRGSPVSGGYASAKRAQWFIADYAREEISRAKLDLRVQTVLPMLNPSTELGRAGIVEYARRAGVSFDEFAKRFSPPLTPEITGRAIVDMFTDREKFSASAYQLGGNGLTAVS